MSFSQIKDGTGQGYAMAVDSNNRAQVQAISEGFNVDAAINGENYNINTGLINLTSANESAVFYMKNDEEKDFIIEEILVIVGESTGGSGNYEIDILRNPTGGSIITNANDVNTVANRNFGSNRALVADTYKGSEGYTITGGSLFAESLRATPAAVSFDADVIILEKGSTIGLRFKPQSGNTSQTVSVAIVGFLFKGGD